MGKTCLDGMSLRIFLREADKHHGKILYEQIAVKAKELGIAGATVFRGIMGFGNSKRIHSAKILRLSLDMPLIVEIVDTEENIGKLLPFLDETVIEGLITLEKVRVIKYRHNGDGVK